MCGSDRSGRGTAGNANDGAWRRSDAGAIMGERSGAPSDEGVRAVERYRERVGRLGMDVVRVMIVVVVGEGGLAVGGEFRIDVVVVVVIVISVCVRAPGVLVLVVVAVVVVREHHGPRRDRAGQVQPEDGGGEPSAALRV